MTKFRIKILNAYDPKTSSIKTDAVLSPIEEEILLFEQRGMTPEAVGHSLQNRMDAAEVVSHVKSIHSKTGAQNSAELLAYRLAIQDKEIDAVLPKIMTPKEKDLAKMIVYGNSDGALTTNTGNLRVTQILLINISGTLGIKVPYAWSRRTMIADEIRRRIIKARESGSLPKPKVEIAEQGTPARPVPAVKGEECTYK